MPRFLDHHPGLKPPPEALQQLKSMVESCQADPNGVTPLNMFFGADGTESCYSEAPNAEAVIKMHAALGVTLERSHITEVESLV